MKNTRRTSLLSAIALALVSFTACQAPDHSVEFDSVEQELAGTGVLITEVMYNPSACSDSTGEWIELFNAGPSAVDIGGWRLYDATTSSITLNAVTLNPGDYYITSRASCEVTPDQTFSFALNNTGDTVTLEDGASNIVDAMSYPDGASSPGQSYERKADVSGPPVDTGSGSDWQPGATGGTPRAGYSANGSQCTIDSDCAGSELCCAGLCVTAACSGDNDCTGSDTCQSPGTCDAACVAPPPPPPPPGAFKVMSYNVEFGGSNPAWKDVVKEENPAIAVFVEVGNWDNNNNALLNQHVAEFNAHFSSESPYHGDVAQNTGVTNTGTALISRYPIVGVTQLTSVTLDGGGSFSPTHDLMIWTVDINGTLVRVVGVYLKCCGGASNEALREDAMEGLINHLDSLGDVPLILMGDFNSFSPDDTGALAPIGDLEYGPLTMLLRPGDPTYGSRASTVHTFTDAFRTLNPIDPGYSYGHQSSTYTSRIDFVIVNQSLVNLFMAPSTVGDTASADVGSDHYCVDVMMDLGSTSTCGDSTCDAGETCTTCAADCGACPTCGDGTCDAGETTASCPADCPPSGDVDISYTDFEAGWGVWTDGGSDARRSINDASFAHQGSYCARIRDNTDTSVITSDSFDLSGYTELDIEFWFRAESMDSSSEDFWVQYSSDGGASWQTLASFAQGTDFDNGVFYFQTVTTSSSAVAFTSDVQLRFRNDASGNSDWVYLDEIRVTAR